jgi:hypothetical protein
MERITRKQLDNAVLWLNKITNSPEESYRKEGDKLVANVGNYHISGPYGVFELHRMVNERGGIRDIFQTGHVPMRELYKLIHAFRRGIEIAREEVTA